MTFFPMPSLPSPKEEERNCFCPVQIFRTWFPYIRARICIVDLCVRASSEHRERARLVTYLMLRLHETTFLLPPPLLPRALRSGLVDWI